MYGSYPYTSIPIWMAALAINTPIAPSPMTPSFLPEISVPAKFFFCFSAAMHDLELPDCLLAVARAGAGVNNIPLDKCAEKGIVVFNTPGANANGVKELVFAGMLYASRDIVGGIDWCLANQNDENIAKTAEKQKKNFAPTVVGFGK